MNQGPSPTGLAPVSRLSFALGFAFAAAFAFSLARQAIAQASFREEQLRIQGSGLALCGCTAQARNTG